VAEYDIYSTKYRLRQGLRAQFHTAERQGLPEFKFRTNEEMLREMKYAF
jgi:DNA polymerase III alpha subunit (gram-positive type)